MLETALFSTVTLPSMPHLYDVLLAGLVLGRPLHGATPQVHGELWFGLTASKLDRRRRNKPPMQEKRRRACSQPAMRDCVRISQPYSLTTVSARTLSHDLVHHQPRPQTGRQRASEHAACSMEICSEARPRRRGDDQRIKRTLRFLTPVCSCVHVQYFSVYFSVEVHPQGR